jgi:hypothetical protein
MVSETCKPVKRAHRAMYDSNRTGYGFTCGVVGTGTPRCILPLLLLLLL